MSSSPSNRSALTHLNLILCTTTIRSTDQAATTRNPFFQPTCGLPNNNIPTYKDFLTGSFPMDIRPQLWRRVHCGGPLCSNSSRITNPCVPLNLHFNLPSPIIYLITYMGYLLFSFSTTRLAIVTSCHTVVSPWPMDANATAVALRSASCGRICPVSSRHLTLPTRVERRVMKEVSKMCEPVVGISLAGFP